MTYSLRRWLRYAARTLALLWAGWWTWFGLASGIGEGLDPAGILVHTAVPGLLFLFSAAVAWRWERVGSVLLFAMGLLTLVWYSFAATLPGFLMLSLPPLAAGALFAAAQYRIETRGSPPSPS